MKRRIAVFALSLITILSSVPIMRTTAVAAAAAPKLLVVEQAQLLAVSVDPAIKKKQNQIVVKQMKYIESVATNKAKAKNLKSFRWTPLLSFKFPQKLDLVMDYDLTVKPLTLQAEIATLKHDRDDLVFEAKSRVGNLFSNIYVLQERIAFSEDVLRLSQEGLERNRAKLLAGTATQADIDTMEKSVEEQTSNIATLKRSFENAKKDLTDMIKLDVTTGYMFKNPLKTASISREQLEGLEKYTLDNDHVYYMARTDESVARLNLDSYEKLFRAQYGGKVNAVSVFLNQARNGQDIDTTAFKEKYAEMLKTFDKPWNGKITIIFFTFTMEWLKGERSGTRYIEDEMYALYTAALDYTGALKDKETAEKALRKRIASEYEALVTAKNSVDSLLKMLGETKTMLARVTELNAQGKADYSEVKDKLDDYQAMQIDAVEAMAVYNELLTGFDRLTCGAVTRLLTGAGLELDTGFSGDSVKDLPTYHIYTDIADLVFAFGVSIPEDYEPEMDAFEIWYEGTQIGVRTPVEKELRHLALDYGESNTLTVRMYSGDEYVDECEIDTTIPTDILNLRGGVKRQEEQPSLGSYSVVTEARTGGAGTSEITLLPAPELNVKYYRISLNGVGLFQGELIPIEKPAKYLTLLVASLESVRVELYNEEKTLIQTARFELKDQTLREAIT